MNSSISRRPPPLNHKLCMIHKMCWFSILYSGFTLRGRPRRRAVAVLVFAFTFLRDENGFLDDFFSFATGILPSEKRFRDNVGDSTLFDSCAVNTQSGQSTQLVAADFRLCRGNTQRTLLSKFRRRHVLRLLGILRGFCIGVITCVNVLRLISLLENHGRDFFFFSICKTTHTCELINLLESQYSRES